MDGAIDVAKSTIACGHDPSFTPRFRLSMTQSWHRNGGEGEKVTAASISLNFTPLR